VSTTSQPASTAEPIAADADALARLVRSAGSYLDKEAGDEIARREVLLQAEANGYSEREAEALVPTRSHFTVPEQGTLFGEMWAVDGVDGVDESDDQAGPLADSAFGDWVRERIDAGDYSHTYTRREGAKRFARGKDVDRYFSRTYERYTTILITYVSPDADDFFPQAVTRKRRRLLKGMDVWQEFAGCTTLAPKLNGDTHAHEFLWIPGVVDPAGFYGLVELFLKHSHAARKAENRRVDAVSGEVHLSREVRSDAPQEFEGDSVRGATTALPQELGRNLPMLYCRGSTVLDAPRYVQEWAEEWGKGATRFKRLGGWEEYASAEREYRRLEKGVRAGKVLREIVDSAQGLHIQER